MEEDAISTAAPERCTKPPAPTVARNVKFHSSQQKAALSTVEIAIRNTDHQDGKKLANGF